MFTEADREQLVQKNQKLQDIKEILKSEFVGINQIIDALIEAVSSWYLFPEMQEKPVVINLWGLTGVGKSSLVKRLVEVLECQNKFLSFNLNDSDWGIRSTMNDCSDYLNGVPMIIAYDEFQHARSLDENGKELKWTNSALIWEVLDKGLLQINSINNYELNQLSQLISKLKYVVEKGVKVSGGKVIANQSCFLEELEPKKLLEHNWLLSADENPSKNEVLFVPVSYLDSFSDLIIAKYRSQNQFREKLTELNEVETINLLSNIYEAGVKPRVLDCTKGLIFILGNLDEAYSMSHEFNPDIDADEFHEASLKINLPIIKESLKKRFRSEHIARLGNIHLIYPAFSKESFYKIIDLELNRISQNIWDRQKIRVSFDASIKELIYQEGVFPTQGTRPLFTTIHQIISAKLGQIFSEMILKSLKVSEILLSFRESFVVVDYKFKDQIVDSLLLPHQSNLENLRKSKQDYKQAVVAVHESGHAIISAILLKTIPEIVFSVTAEVNANGFVYTKLKSDLISKKDIFNRLAYLLAGFVAERIVFGEDFVTTGAENDIEKATGFVLRLLKESGFGLIPGAYHEKDYHSRGYLFDSDDKITKQAESWICLAVELAQKTLWEQEVLLIKMADYLSDNSHIKKAEITQMLREYAVNVKIEDLTQKSELDFYREHLKFRAKQV